MPSLSTAASYPIVVSSDTDELIGFDLIGMFPEGGVQSGDATCVEASQSGANDAAGTVATTDLDIAQAIVNEEFVLNGRTVEVGEGLQARISGFVNGGNYVIKATATDGDNTKSLYCTIQCRDTY